jgi:hypothetical protein
MRRVGIFATFLLAAVLARPATPGEVVDRIVARIDGDIITLGEVRELGAYQKLAGGSTGLTEETLLRQLVDQWIVATDAAAARFPQPELDDVDSELARLEHSVGTPQAFASRLAALGLTAKALRRMVTRQLYLEHYLDYKFRPTVQIDPKAIERYYQESLLPELKARNESSPPMESVSEQIREVLVQRDISRRSEEWLVQTRGQVHVERMDAQSTKETTKPAAPAEVPKSGPKSAPKTAPVFTPPAKPPSSGPAAKDWQ